MGKHRSRNKFSRSILYKLDGATKKNIMRMIEEKEQRRLEQRVRRLCRNQMFRPDRDEWSPELVSLLESATGIQKYL